MGLIPLVTLKPGTRVEQTDRGALVLFPPGEPPFGIRIDGDGAVWMTSVSPDAMMKLTIGIVPALWFWEEPMIPARLSW